MKINGLEFKDMHDRKFNSDFFICPFTSDANAEKSRVTYAKQPKPRWFSDRREFFEIDVVACVYAARSRVKTGVVRCLSGFNNGDIKNGEEVGCPFGQITSADWFEFIGNGVVNVDELEKEEGDKGDKGEVIDFHKITKS